MKLGLVRHFKVNLEYPKRFLISFEELLAWFATYDRTEVKVVDADLGGVEWTKCYSSTMLRAVHTAKTIYSGEITATDALRELDILPLMRSSLRLPLVFWAIWIRRKSMASNPITDAFRARIRNFLDEQLAGNPENLLIVSHGFVMLYLEQELVRRGFSGKRIGRPAHGKVYVFEKLASK
ncbi:MAG: histidine phosphatase family protein [Cytophagales bacterium]|nr:histidine phosphatase family protein [Cytophagales bacterium]